MLLKLFLGFLQVGLFSFGGGYAALPLLRQQIIIGGWMTADEFTDLLAISQMTPGPIAINTAAFVGLKTAGLPGALVATFSFILPSVIIVSLLAYLYRRYNDLPVIQNVLSGVRPAATGLILSAALYILVTALFGTELHMAVLDDINLVALALTCAGVSVLRLFKAPLLLVIAACGAAGGVIYTLF